MKEILDFFSVETDGGRISLEVAQHKDHSLIFIRSYKYDLGD
jgi:hypothetical protein